MTPEFLQVDTECSEGYEKSVYTKMIRAGHRTYYIDVKQTRSGKYFMSITELRRKITEDGTSVCERSKVHIYEEAFAKFAEGMNDVMEYVSCVVEEPAEE